jgi:hypothetical protein
VNAPRITEHGSAVENYKLTSGAFQGWQKTCFFNLKQNIQFLRERGRARKRGHAEIVRSKERKQQERKRRG